MDHSFQWLAQIIGLAAEGQCLLQRREVENCGAGIPQDPFAKL